MENAASKTTSMISRLPSFYEADNPHSLLFQVLNVFGQLMEQTEIDLYEVMRSHFVETADNQASQGFGSKQQNDLDKIFSMYLEALGSTSQLMQQNDFYRQRMLTLIRVLRRGAATQEGIRDIVAANLGIFEDDFETGLSSKLPNQQTHKTHAAAKAAKELIKVEEFLPELISKSLTLHPFSTDSTPPIALTFLQTFSMRNPNVFPSAVGFRVEIQDTRLRSSESAAPLQPLEKLRFVNLNTQDFVELPVMLKVNDVLRLLPTGELLINGIKESTQVTPFLLPLGTSEWRIDAFVGEVVGRFDRTLFDLSRYEAVPTASVAINREQAINYSIALEIELTRFTPGAFRVRIPWNIPGFTDKFNTLHDHPRTQIPAIINKVKAAGVLAVIDYEQTWREIHLMQVRLAMVRSPFTEVHAIEEGNFDIGSCQNIQEPKHEMSDQLRLTGMFDYTMFDSMNYFAD